MTNRRLHCPHCMRPATSCICSHACSLANPISVVILQHPLEVKEPKNTGMLLHLCLKNSQLLIGETFEEAIFLMPPSKRQIDMLLYPESSEEKSLGILTAPPLKIPTPDIEPCDLRLWVLDATWRKSRKMLYLNPSLQKMPRIALQDTPESLYTIRKAHSENQLSTLEATCYALHSLEKTYFESSQIDYNPALNAMKVFIARQHSYIPIRP